MYDDTPDSDLILDAGEIKLDAFSVEEGDISADGVGGTISANA